MTDREKAVLWLNSFVKNKEPMTLIPKQLIRLMHDALKEQEPIKRTCRTGINGFSIIWTCGACGSDLHPNNAKAKYCSNCGQAVKWE